MLINLKISQYPSMQSHDQLRLHRQMHQLAYPHVYDTEAQAVTIAELGKRLATQLGGDT